MFSGGNIKSMNAVSKSYILSKSLVGTLLLIISFCSGGAFASKPESRALTDEHFVWVTNKGASDIINKMKSSGLNVFMPYVWHGRGVSWPSKLAKKEDRWLEYARSSFDPLQELIDQAHKNGIDVHPSFTLMLRQRPFKKEFYDEGTPKDSFNVHNVEFRKFIASVVIEVVNNYEIDGINLDFVRAKGTCHSDFCVQDYKAKTGRDLISDIEAQAKKPLGEAWMSIAHWNRAAVTDLIRQISQAVRAAKPQLIISVDSHPQKSWTIQEGANSIGWANEGLIDLIYNMQYKKSLEVDLIKKSQLALNDPAKLAIMVGDFDRSLFNKNNVFPRAADLFLDNLTEAIELTKSSKAVAVYDYRWLSDEHIDVLNNLFLVPEQQ